jgi:nicotinate-nucleotide pyrophosphorylase (carboxylating)
MRQVDNSITLHWEVEDGDSVNANSIICRLQGPATSILSAERCALNFLQTLSATASLTHQYVQAIRDSRCKILDTRKTLPGLRHAQKYAVLCGGGHNHRMGLYDAILLKENHICALGSVEQAVHAAKTRYPDLMIEIEVETAEQLQQAMHAGAQRALLDNMDLPLLRECVKLAQQTIELEASGGISLETVAAIAATGVDYISVGNLTKNVQAVDLSMRFESL